MFDDLDEDGRISNKEYAYWLAKRSLIYSLSSIPFIRDLAALGSGFGYSLTPMDSLGKGLERSISSVSKAIDEGEMTEASLKGVISAVGFAAGLPVTQLNRIAKTYYKMEDGEDVDWYDWVRGYREPSTSAFKD